MMFFEADQKPVLSVQRGLTSLPVRKGAFQNPELVAYGERIASDYKKSLAEARLDVAIKLEAFWYDRHNDLYRVFEKHGHTTTLEIALHGAYESYMRAMARMKAARVWVTW
jgi:hypothetical protein